MTNQNYQRKMLNRLNKQEEIGRDVNIGYKVKEMRESLHLTQEELSQKSGVSRGTISSIENGDTKTTTTKTLLKLAKAMNTSIDQNFFCGHA